jgi:uncharacterized membrane protein YoaK (UPF0700 family)
MTVARIAVMERSHKAPEAMSAAVSSPSELQRITLFFLSFVAGYVDACTFLALFGLFVAQVTGSFVIAGTAPVVHQAGFLLKALAIPAFMVAAVAATVLVAMTRATSRTAWPWVLGLEGILLIAFLWLGLMNSPLHSPDEPAALMAGLCGLAAMGVQSASVRLLAHGAPSTNVMTTNTTQFAVDATQLLLGRFRIAAGAECYGQLEIGKVRQRLVETARVMIGFFAGVVLGALAFRLFGFIGLAPVIGILFCLVVVTSHPR